MATDAILQNLTLLAGADLSSHQYRWMRISAAGTITFCSVAGQASVGVLQDDPDEAGKGALLAIGGKSRVEAGGTIAAGAKIATDSVGRAVAASDDDEVLGTAVDSAVVGDIFAIIIEKSGSSSVPLQIIAGDDYSAKAGYLGQVDASGEVSLPGAGEVFHGIVTSATAAAALASLATGGSVSCIAGDTVVAGDPIASDSAGRGVAASALDYVGGVALTGALVGNAFTVLLLPGLQRVGADISRVPSNIETAAWTAALVDTWEDEDMVALFNAALGTNIETSKAIQFRGVLEIISADGLAHDTKIGDGGTPDNDDTVAEYASSLAIGSDFFDVNLATDASGNIKFEVDDVANVTLVMHLKSFQYITNTAVA